MVREGIGFSENEENVILDIALISLSRVLSDESEFCRKSELILHKIFNKYPDLMDKLVELAKTRVREAMAAAP